MDSERPEVRAQISHKDSVNTVCFSPDQTKLCSAGDDKEVILTNLQTYQTERVLVGSRGFILGSDFSSRGDYLVTGSSCRKVLVWNLSESGNNSTTLEGHTNWVECVRYFRSNQSNVISGSHDETIKIWSVERKKEISTLPCVGSVRSVDILPNDQTLVNGDSDLRIWDLRTNKCVQDLDHESGCKSSVHLHPNSFSLACGTSDPAIKIFDIRTFKLLHEYQDEHEFAVLSVCFHPSGKFLLSGSFDDTIKIFDLLEKKVLFTLKHHSYSSPVESVKFPPDGNFFASGSEDEKVFLWNFPLGKMIRAEEQDSDEEERVKYLVDQDFLPLLSSSSSCCCCIDEDCCERNYVTKIRIDDFYNLYCYKFFFVM